VVISADPERFPRLETLSLLQDLVHSLLRTSGLSDGGFEINNVPHRLHVLRQRLGRHSNHASNMEGSSLSQWHPMGGPPVRDKTEDDDPQPPDRTEKYLKDLSRVTLLMAGAIFGAILLYLCRECGRVCSTYR
jgi:hypothetical protein